MYSNNYRELVIEEIKADPESFGISTGFKALKIASSSAGTSVNLVPILANAGEDPYLYQTFTVDNFYYRINSSVGTVCEGNYLHNPTMSYDSTTGVFTFTTGVGNRWSSSHGDLVNGVPYVDVYLIY